MMLTQSVSGEGQNLNATETILQNLRVLATDQRTETTTNEDGKTVVKAFRTVTLEATPKIAEKIAVAQTIGTLSLSLRSLADSQSDLDRAVAQGNFKLTDGLSKDAETKMISKASSAVQDGGATYTTGGDVSRFQSRSLSPKAQPAAHSGDGSGAQAPAGPAVRVYRGQAVTVTPIEKFSNSMDKFTDMVNRAQSQGANGVARALPSATAASMAGG